jgi:phosphate transport system substrate-binding protein
LQTGFPSGRRIFGSSGIRCHATKSSTEKTMKTGNIAVVNRGSLRGVAVNRALGLVLGCTLAAAAYGQTTERVIIDGSTGVTPLVAALATAYREQHPGVTVEIGKGMGTKERIRALAEGRIDIAMASHGLVADELVRQGMAVNEIAKIAVVFGVNATVPVAVLAENQICDIYSGRLANWKELGGPDLPVAPRTRPDSEVDAQVVRQRVGCLAQLKMPEAVRVMPKAGDMARELARTAGAIGMTTTTVVEQSQARVKPLALNGVEPTPQNVRSGAYGLTRDSYLVTKAAPAPAVARFLEFVRGPDGKRVISANGAVPQD